MSIKITRTPHEMIEEGIWETFCSLFEVDVYAVSEGMIDPDKEIAFTLEEAIMLDLL